MSTKNRSDCSDTLVTRVEAVDVLYEIINSGIISMELEEKLREIANIIEDEDKENGLGILAWGMNAEEYGELHTVYRKDLWTDERRAKMQAIYDSVKY